MATANFLVRTAMKGLDKTICNTQNSGLIVTHPAAVDAK